MLKMVKIKTKITVLVFLAISLSIAMIGISIYLFVSPMFRQQLIDDNGTIVSKVTQQISYSLEDIVNYATGIALNEKIQSLYKDIESTSGYDYFNNIFKMDTTLLQYTLLRSSVIEDIFVMNRLNQPLDFNNMYIDIAKERWFDPFRSDRMKNGFSEPFFVTTRLNSPPVKVIAYVMNVYDETNTRLYFGKLVIFLKYDVLIKPMMMTDRNEGIQLMALDGQGRSIFSPVQFPEQFDFDTASAGPPHERVTFRNGYYFLSEHIPASGWNVVGAISENHLNAGMKYINLVLPAMALIGMVVMSLVIYPVVSNIIKPLHQLIRGMRQVSKGQLETRIQVRSGDEIEEVAHIFNNMVVDIKRLVEESVQSEQKKRQLALHMFMYQINPHFIYNTLNSVIYLARRANAPDIAELTRSFISYLQRTIKSQPETFSTLRGEMENIEDYGRIVSFRYHDKIEIVWEIEGELLDCCIPQMILHPLVENSIFHGILPSSSEGIIRIRTREENGMLHIAVEDNGVGISEARLETLRRQLYASSAKEEDIPDHIGLWNVNNRLKLLFGEGCTLQIDSKEQSGTRIDFAIPIVGADHDIIKMYKT